MAQHGAAEVSRSRLVPILVLVWGAFFKLLLGT